MSYADTVRTLNTCWRVEAGQKGKKCDDGHGPRLYVLTLDVETHCLKASYGISTEAAKIAVTIAEKILVYCADIATDDIAGCVVKVFQPLIDVANKKYIVPAARGAMHDIAGMIPGSGEAIDNFYALITGPKHSPPREWKDMHPNAPFGFAHFPDTCLKIFPLLEDEAAFVDISADPDEEVAQHVELSQFAVPYARYEDETRQAKLAYAEKEAGEDGNALYFTGFDYDDSSADDIVTSFKVNPYALAQEHDIGVLADPASGKDPYRAVTIPFLTVHHSNKAVYMHLLKVQAVKPNS